MAVFAAIMAVFMAIASAPTAMAATDGYGCAYLYDNGVAATNATTDWKFYVSTPSYLGIDQDYLNITVYGWMVNNTGAAASGNYTVTVYIDDGATNITASSTLAMVNTSTSHVYGNISIAAAAYAGLVTNASGVYYVTLELGESTLDDIALTIAIDSTAMNAAILAIIPMVIGVFAVVLVFSALSGAFSKMNFGSSKGRGKRR